jgi:hypothetical protein
MPTANYTKKICCTQFPGALPSLRKKNKGWCVTLYIKKLSILRQNKNYGNSNISPCKNIIIKKNTLKETKILQDIIITLL